jgi:hypothetical protein
LRSLTPIGHLPPKPWPSPSHAPPASIPLARSEPAAGQRLA